MAYPAAYRELVDPEDQRALEGLDLISKQIVDGFLSGRHRSRMKGGCTEFAEHRAYSPGDEVRLLDWKVFAKSDRYYIKQFEEETTLNGVLVLDSSGSMGFGMSTATKFHYARSACATIARLLLSQRDPVGIAVSCADAPQFIPPRTAASHFRVILHQLTESQPSGNTLLIPTLDDLARRVRRRGLIIIASDCFVDLDKLQQSMRMLRSRGHQMVLLHTMAPEELEFSFQKGSRFRCLEADGYHVDLDPTIIRDQYIESLNAFLGGLKKTCNQNGCDYVPLRTSDPLGETLARYLRGRAAGGSRR